jgi:hypothetical protein
MFSLIRGLSIPQPAQALVIVRRPQIHSGGAAEMGQRLWYIIYGKLSVISGFLADLLGWQIQ